MLARTHGQPASPTKLGKEISVFKVRIEEQLKQLLKIPHSAKFGGATGNLNAHYASYPKQDWHKFAKEFLNGIGLKRSYPTTQIEHYDNLASQLDAIKRINTILIDLCRDIWIYISMNYFNQKINKNEVGSSAMPHKVNPIDFENAEGNLGVANALLTHLSEKLPISRLQRDLSDSTVMRNLGVPIAHTIISYKAIMKGLNKLFVNKEKIEEELNDNWAIISEAIQTILRREGVNNPYEKLKELTRQNKKIKSIHIEKFIDSLKISDKIKQELKKINPTNYTGKS
jgi:adenylosuccinate lyase